VHRDLMPEDDQRATRNLFIGNLDHNVSEVELRRAFEKYGIIEEVVIKRPARGFCPRRVHAVRCLGPRLARCKRQGCFSAARRGSCLAPRERRCPAAAPSSRAPALLALRRAAGPFATPWPQVVG
uniref:RRM domain-containing protein n=1 Tax=Dromaius novaehollandiae TaxID=8790 RepID=A0A8C4K0V8_DRONO